MSGVTSCASNMTANLSPFWAGTLNDSFTWKGMNIYVGDDLKISSGKTLTLGETSTTNVKVYVKEGKKIEVEGTLNNYSTADNNPIRTLTVRSGSSGQWSGIDIKTGGIFDVDDECIIEKASWGIDFYGGSINNGTNTITIQNCSDGGVAINSSYAPTAQNIKVINCGSYYGGITKSGTSNNPIIQYCTVQTSKYGLYVSGNSTVDYCNFVVSNTDHSITIPSSTAVDLNGHNNIHPAANKKAINNLNDSGIDAQNNWWGKSAPTSDQFTFPTYVNYTNAYAESLTTAGVYKTAMQEEPLEIAEKLEFSGDHVGAIKMYQELLASEKDTLWKKFLITSMLRAHDNYDKKYDDLKSVIANEQLTADGYYKAALNYILNDIYVREDDYTKAIDGFNENINNYKDTSMEVEMLGRIAEIYGNYLKNNEKALEYANLAASKNPGQLMVRSAYNAAGIEYNPAFYTDKFKDVVENFDVQPAPDKPVPVELTNSVALSPNPFNPITTINYSITNPGHVSLSVYNITGQKVATLVNSSIPAGKHIVSFDGSNLASGIYFYRFETPGFSKTGKMMLVK